MSGAGPSDTQKDRFEDRLFNWAREEFAHELASDFARLRALRGRSAQGGVAYMDESDDATCRELATAMLLRFHPAASARAGLAATPAQRRLFEVANLRRLDLTTHLPPCKPAGVKLPQLRGAAHQALDPLLGKPQNIDGPHTWRHRTPVGGVVLVTVVDLSGASRQLEYEHQVEAKDGRLLRRGISLQSWLGFSSTTQWDLLQPEHVEDAVHQMLGLCRHFLQVLPRLVA